MEIISQWIDSTKHIFTQDICINKWNEILKKQKKQILDSNPVWEKLHLKKNRIWIKLIISWQLGLIFLHSFNTNSLTLQDGPINI